MLAIQSPYVQFYGLDTKPLDGGYLYFGAASQNPETNPITVYWDAAGTQPAAQPIRTLNGFPVRAGTPSEIYIGVDYSITVRDSLGRFVVYSQNSANYSLASAIEAATAAQQAASAASSGSSLIGFINSGAGAILRTIQSVLRGHVRIRDYGAVCDGVTDDTAAIQAAVNFASQKSPTNSWFDIVFGLLGKGAPRTVDFEGATCKVMGTVLVPPGVLLNGGNATLIGSGNTVSDNTCFESAYWSGSSLVSNLASADESQVVQGLRIEGIRFFNFGIALKFKNVCEGCSFENLDFGECYQAMYLERCFYSSWKGVFIRENIALSASTAPAIHLKGFTNVVFFDEIGITQRPLAMLIEGAANGFAPRNVSIETCTTGMKFIGESGPVNIDSCYFEGITGTAIDMSVNNGGKTVTIDNCWFNVCGTAISGVNMFGGHIGPGNRYENCTVKVNIPDNGSFINVDIPITNVPDNVGTAPVTPAGWILGTSVRVFYPVTVVSSLSNVAQIRSDTLINNFVDLPYFGQAGHVTNQVAFCTCSHTGTTTATAIVDTRMNFDVYAMGVYFIKIVDSVGSTFIAGRFYGANVVPDIAVGKTVTISNNGGYFRLSVSTFNGVDDSQFEGIVRFV